jgi:hypothetical protein
MPLNRLACPRNRFAGQVYRIVSDTSCWEYATARTPTREINPCAAGNPAARGLVSWAGVFFCNHQLLTVATFVIGEI